MLCIFHDTYLCVDMLAAFSPQTSLVFLAFNRTFLWNLLLWITANFFSKVNAFSGKISWRSRSEKQTIQVFILVDIPNRFTVFKTSVVSVKSANSTCDWKLAILCWISCLWIESTGSELDSTLTVSLFLLIFAHKFKADSKLPLK